MAFLHTVALTLIGIGSVFALLNWLSLCETLRTGRFCSAIPLVGAVPLGGGMLLLPTLRAYAWVALLVDYGTLIFFISLPRLVQEVWSTSRYNLLEEYVGHQDTKTVYLRLFRRGVFTIEQHIRRQPGEYGLIQTGAVGNWHRERNRLVVLLYGQSIEFEPLAGATPQSLRQVGGPPAPESSRELSLSGMELTLRYKRDA